MMRRSLVLFLVLASLPSLVRSAELSERGTAMVDAMIGAMDAVGLIERGRKYRDSFGDGSGWSSGSPSSGFNMPGASSFGGWPSGFPGSGFGMPGSSPFGMPGSSPFGMPGASPFGMPGTMPFGMPGASGFGMPGGSPFGGGSSPLSPWSSMPWSGGSMPWGSTMPGTPFGGSGQRWPMPSMDNLPWGGGQGKTGSSRVLEGTWEGQGGELLLIRDGMFRIYADAETYRDGYLQVSGERLQLKDAESGRTRDYEMRHQGDQLALRTPDGEILLYRRIGNDDQGR